MTVHNDMFDKKRTKVSKEADEPEENSEVEEEAAVGLSLSLIHI